MPLGGWRARCQLPQAEISSQTEARDLANFESPHAQDESWSETFLKKFQTIRLALWPACQNKYNIRDMRCLV
jgi:hypothetical protein